MQSGDHLAISVLICIQTWVRNYKTILFLLAYAIFLVWLWFGWSIWFCNKTSQIVPLFCQIWTEEIYRQIAKQSHYFFFFVYIAGWRYYQEDRIPGWDTFWKEGQGWSEPEFFSCWELRRSMSLMLLGLSSLYLFLLVVRYGQKKTIDR